MRINLLLICLLPVIFQACKKKEPLKTVTTVVPPPTSVFFISSVLQSNMVVQRDKPFKIWGHTKAGDTVNVSASWNNGTLTTIADNNGDWLVTVPSTPVNTNPQTITAKDNKYTAVTLKNILIGDVWLCAGQSNMVMPLDSNITYPGVVNYKAEIAAANYPQLRMMYIDPAGPNSYSLTTDYQTTPQQFINSPGAWKVCAPATAANFGALGYYFGRKISTTLNVPVGLVMAAVMGVYCECFASAQVIQDNATLQAYYGGRYYNSLLYNSMIYPLANLSIKGFLWDQGEANRYDEPLSDYTLLNASMISDWRNLFNQGNLPFYYVQMTPLGTPGDDVSADYSKFREAQANVRPTQTNTGMVVTMDINEIGSIHYRNKELVANRLAALALNGTYGQDVPSTGPQYLSFTNNNNVTITLNFVAGTATGLNTINNARLNQVFYIAGSDEDLRQCVATISGEQIILQVPAGTPLPITAIRVAFTDAAVENLQNAAGFLMEPFRTDDWNNK